MTDEQLITLAGLGKSEAVAMIYDKYFESIYRFFYWQTNFNEEDAQDLTQDTFIQMAKSIKNFKGEGSFKNWLYTIAKRLLNSWIKEKYNLPKTELLETIQDDEDWIDPEEQDVKVQKVNELLSTLDEREQQVIRLRFLRNYSVKEVAEELNLSESNVKVLTHRIIKSLQNRGG